MRLLLPLGIWLLIMVSARAAETRTIVDMAGRRVQIPAKVERVATVGGTPAVNAFLFALGEADAIQNGMPSFMASKSWKYQAVFGPHLAGRPVVSDSGPDWVPRLEALKMLPHDVAFVVNGTSADMLAQHGFTVVSLDWKNPDSIKQTIDLLGDIMGVPERAREYDRAYDDILSRVRTAVKDESWHPRTLYLRVSGYLLPMVTTATWMIENAGGRNVARDVPDHSRVSAEQILAWNPEVIFVWDRGDVAALLADKRLASLEAVRQRRIFVVPMGAHMWTHYTPEQPLAVLWAASHFYPERFRDVSLREVTRDFYSRFFRTKLTEAQLSEILVEEEGEK